MRRLFVIIAGSSLIESRKFAWAVSVDNPTFVRDCINSDGINFRLTFVLIYRNNLLCNRDIDDGNGRRLALNIAKAPGQIRALIQERPLIRAHVNERRIKHG